MRLLVEFSHPAQVHKFKNLLLRIRAQGATVRVLSRDKDVMLQLLDELGIDHVCISRARSGYIGTLCELLLREWQTLVAVLRFQPTLTLSAHSVAITHIAWLLRIPCIVHEDTEFGTLQQTLYMPFATQIVTTTAYQKDWGSRHTRINSLEPLAYLHPSEFDPDPSILSKYGLRRGVPYVVLRLIAWRALHDHGLRGLAHEDFLRVIAAIKSAGIERLVLSAESNIRSLPNIDAVVPEPNDLHHLLAFAKLCISESITVAGEAAVLGTPTILVNPLEAGHTLELERYGLIERLLDNEAVIARAVTILNDTSTFEARSRARQRLLSEKVPFTDAFEALLRNATQS